MSKVIGDPERLAEEAVKDDVEKSRKLLSEASGAALKLLDDSYKRALEEAEKALSEEFSNLEEQIKSLRSKLEFEVKSRLAERRNAYINSVLEEARKRLKEAKMEEWYRDFMSRVVELLASEAGSTGKLIVKVAVEDYELAASIASRYGGLLEVSREPANILGGLIAETPGGETRLDYSLDHILERNEARLRNVALKALIE